MECGLSYSREELGVVVLLAGLELLPPLQEGPECGVGLLVHDALVPLRPHLQANQGHSDVQGPVELYTQKSHIFKNILTHYPILCHTYNLVMQYALRQQFC